MPLYKIGAETIFIPERSLLIDTNVICSAFLNEGGDRSGVSLFLNEYMAEEQFTALILTDVIVETWGLVVGSKKERQCGCDILAWLSDPTKVTLVPLDRGLFHRSKVLCDAMQIDYIDALLIESSFQISQSCGIRGPVPIATLERRDYYEYMRYRKGTRLSLYDPIQMEEH